MLQYHTLPPLPGKKKYRIGRGNARRGNYSGRGMKGQRARSGGKGGLKLRGLKQSMLAVPKVRGFHSQAVRAQIVNLADLHRVFDDGATIALKEFIEKKLVRSARTPIKILGQGTLTKKLHVNAQAVSVKAREMIVKAGGTVTIIAKDPVPKKARVRKTANI